MTAALVRLSAFEHLAAAQRYAWRSAHARDETIRRHELRRLTRRAADGSPRAIGTCAPMLLVSALDRDAQRRAGFVVGAAVGRSSQACVFFAPPPRLGVRLFARRADRPVLHRRDAIDRARRRGCALALDRRNAGTGRRAAMSQACGCATGGESKRRTSSARCRRLSCSASCLKTRSRIHFSRASPGCRARQSSACMCGSIAK